MKILLSIIFRIILLIVSLILTAFIWYLDKTIFLFRKSNIEVKRKTKIAFTVGLIFNYIFSWIAIIICLFVNPYMCWQHGNVILSYAFLLCFYSITEYGFFCEFKSVSNDSIKKAWCIPTFLMYIYCFILLFR